jgi:hypothetical protein
VGHTGPTTVSWYVINFKFVVHSRYGRKRLQCHSS